MSIERLDSKDYRNLGDLLRDPLERCAKSMRLTARIDFPIYHQGKKYGCPIFTHEGAAEAPDQGKTFGVIGMNRLGQSGVSRVAVEFLKSLELEPDLAGGAEVKILPVADPVVFEVENPDSTISDWQASRHVSGGFHGLACDGQIELSCSSERRFWIEGNVTPRMLRAISDLRSKRRSRSVDDEFLTPSHVYLKRVNAGSRWDLQLNLPEPSLTKDRVAGVAEFVAGIFRFYSALRVDAGKS